MPASGIATAATALYAGCIAARRAIPERMGDRSTAREARRKKKTKEEGSTQTYLYGIIFCRLHCTLHGFGCKRKSSREREKESKEGGGE